MKAALPSRYEVDRRGTPDPENVDYYVLDSVNDFQARVALRFYVNSLRLGGKDTQADEIEAGLKASHDRHVAAMSRNNPAPKSKK